MKKWDFVWVLIKMYSVKRVNEGYIMESVLNLSFSKVKKEILGGEREGDERATGKFFEKPTDLTLDTGEVSCDGVSFVLKNTKFETPVLAEFEALNISLILKNGSVASVMKSSLLDQEDLEGYEKTPKPLAIEISQVNSSFWCSSCIMSEQKILSNCCIY